MANITSLERYIPGSRGDNVSFNPAKVNSNILEVSGGQVQHLETRDFPLTDPWSEYLRKIIAGVRDRGVFNGRLVTEFGVGDGRNLRLLESRPAGMLGIDVESWRVEVAGANFVSDTHLARIPLELWSGDAVGFLQDCKARRRSLDGWVIMCLPQSPEGINSADRYDGASNLDPYRGDWERSGLTLNAAVLDNLRTVSDRSTRVLIILSDRVPDGIKESLFSQTGWVGEAAYRTEHPIQQDPDTGIAWVQTIIDDGRRFYQQVNGHFEAITAVEAERRRKQSLDSGAGRKELNVYHNLTVYSLRPKLND